MELRDWLPERGEEAVAPSPLEGEAWDGGELQPDPEAALPGHVIPAMLLSGNPQSGSPASYETDTRAVG
jgi:hypothetical protein